MNEPSYELTVLKEAHRFDFLSIGWTAIHKAVIFFTTKAPQVYNVVLADILADGELDIYSVSNNGDMKFILSTVHKAIIHFLTLNPEAVICFTGSTEGRTRLYQIAISSNLEALEENFNIFGTLKKEGFPEAFCKGRIYDHFFICRKNVRFV
jgi:hypothetical protein